MAGPLLADWKTGFGSDATAVTGLPTWQTGVYVYDKTEYTQAGGDNDNFVYNPYLITKATYYTDGAGVIVGKDKTTAADGVADSILSAHFYISTDLGGNEKEIHESDLTDLAGIKTFIGTEVSDWTDPA